MPRNINHQLSIKCCFIRSDKMFNQTCSILLLFCLACLMQVMVSSKEVDIITNRRDWQQLHYQVYDSDGVPLDPAVTHKLLIDLFEIEKQGTDSRSMERKEKIEALLHACLIDDEDCVDQTYKDIQDLIHYNGPFKINVVPYLNYCKKMQFEHCQPAYEKRAREAAEGLSKEDFTDMKNLRELVDQAGKVTQKQKNLLIVPRKNLIKGLIDFTNNKKGPIDATKFKTKKQGRIYLDDYFWKPVHELCPDINRAFYESQRVYDNFIRDEKLVSLLNEYTRYWILNAEICKDILQGYHGIVDELYDQYRPEHKSFFSCFRKPSTNE